MPCGGQHAGGARHLPLPVAGNELIRVSSGPSTGLAVRGPQSARRERLHWNSAAKCQPRPQHPGHLPEWLFGFPQWRNDIPRVVRTLKTEELGLEPRRRRRGDPRPAARGARVADMGCPHRREGRRCGSCRGNGRHVSGRVDLFTAAPALLATPTFLCRLVPVRCTRDAGERPWG